MDGKGSGEELSGRIHNHPRFLVQFWFDLYACLCSSREILEIEALLNSLNQPTIQLPVSIQFVES